MQFVGYRQKPIRVETCNACAQRLNIHFAKYHIWKHEEFVRECLTRNDTRNIIFGFGVSCLNFDLNAVNFLQKLKKFIKCIEAKFSRLLHEDETGEFNQIQLYSTKLVQKQDYAIKRELARAVTLIQILQF